jgi:c-di-GMP-related signal transduction protein
MVSTPQPAPSQKPCPWIARQPILALDESVQGYELLFRENGEERRYFPDGANATDADNATLATIDTLNLMGLEVLCDSKSAFINCTQSMLLKGYFALLPPADTVVEIHESVPADATVETVCQRLKQAGYRIALDHFVPSDPRVPLVEYADFLKVDIKRLTPEENKALAAGYGAEHRRMLALKVETRQDFVTAKHAGYTLFQGYFFRRPEHLQARQIPANQATFLRLLQAISKSQLDFSEIEDLIKHEPSLCYRLLRYLNSPLIGLSSPVRSVRHALNLLGEREAVRWIRMATTLVMGQERTSDLVLASLVRARFCELLAPKVKHGNSDLFLLGMLSLMDAILEMPIGMVVEELCLDSEIKAQLLSGKTSEKTNLSPIYDLMVAREAGDWSAVTSLGKQLNLSLYFMAESYNAAMKWGHEMTSTARSAAPASE